MKLLVFDTHPVQYRVPLWQSLAKEISEFLVVYASDKSKIGYLDKEFNQNISWDDPLTENYNHVFLNNFNPSARFGLFSYNGKGLFKIFRFEKPTYVLLTGFNYIFDLYSLFLCKMFNIRVGIRCETQDEAIKRAFIKEKIRYFVYNFIYKFIDDFFYIGQLNKRHYLRHNVLEKDLHPAHYFTVNRYENWSVSDKKRKQNDLINEFKIGAEKFIIGFSGKFIEKKNPKILFEVLNYLPKTILDNLVLYIIGNGPLKLDLEARAKLSFEKYNIPTYFPGFINQSQIGNHYLLLDLLILPSRFQGETWGLVVNEALQAGSSVIVSSAVGCKEDFKSLKKFEIFKDDSAQELAEKIIKLYSKHRDFDWATDFINTHYSANSVSNSMISFIKNIKQLPFN